MSTHSNLSYRTSQVNHAGDSIPQTTKQDTGVGSGVWLGHPVSLPYVVEGDFGNGCYWSLCFSAPVGDTPASHWVDFKNKDDAWRIWALVHSIPTTALEEARNSPAYLYFRSASDRIAQEAQRLNEDPAS